MKKIQLTKGKHALVDNDDYAWLSRHKWHTKIAPLTHYARSRVNGKMVLMHRHILGVTEASIIIDHINGDGFDNRRSNLRIATRSQNAQNSRKRRGSLSTTRGVFVHKDTRRERRYGVRLVVNRRVIFGGYYKTEAEAGSAYNKLALKHYGRGARLNDMHAQHREVISASVRADLTA
jgi:hypothetical protein